MPSKFSHLSWGARYLLMILSKESGSLLSTQVDNMTQESLANIAGVSLKSVHTYLKELNDNQIINIKRDLIFGRGRGVNSYILYEKFDIGLLPPKLNEMIMGRVVSISDLSALSKFILIYLVSFANNLGIVTGKGIQQLAQEIGVTHNTLKTHLDELVEDGYLFGYFSGCNLPIFSGKVKSTFYLDFIHFSQNLIPPQESTKATLAVSQQFVPNYQFIDISVEQYFKEYSPRPLQQYIDTLAINEEQSFFDTLSAAVFYYTGELLTDIQSSLLKRNDKLRAFIHDLTQEAFFTGSIGNTIESTDIKLAIKLISDFNDLSFKRHINVLKGHLFSHSPDSALLDQVQNILKEELYNLINYYAYRISVELVNIDPFPYHYALVKCSNKKYPLDIVLLKAHFSSQDHQTFLTT